MGPRIVHIMRRPVSAAMSGRSLQVWVGLFILTLAWAGPVLAQSAPEETEPPAAAETAAETESAATEGAPGEPASEEGGQQVVLEIPSPFTEDESDGADVEASDGYGSPASGLEPHEVEEADNTSDREELTSPSAPSPPDNGAQHNETEQEAHLETRLAAAQRPWHLALTGAVTETFFSTDSASFVSEDDQLTAGEVAVEGEWRFFDALSTRLFVGYAGGDLDQVLFDRILAESRLHSLQVGVLVGYRFWEWLMPFVRGWFSQTWMDLALSSEDYSVPWVGKGGYASASGGGVSGGVEATLPRGWIARGFRTAQFTFGLRAEGGYQALGKLEHSLQSNSSLLARSTTLRLGTVDLQGAMFRVTFVAYF